MDYKKIDNHFVIRLDVDDKIVESLQKVAKEEKISLATIQGIGAVKSFIVGLFNPVTKKYQEKEFNGPYEITSLVGNITTKQGEPYLHIHATLGNDEYQIIGGHLKEGVIGVTGEIFITPIHGTVERVPNQIGINLMEF